MTGVYLAQSADGRPNTFRPGQLIVDLAHSEAATALAAIQALFPAASVPDELSDEDQGRNEAAAWMGDRPQQLRVITGLEQGIGAAAAAEIMLELLAEPDFGDAIRLNRVMFLGTGGWGPPTEGEECCGYIEQAAAVLGAPRRVMTLNPWWADPWWADPWWADPWWADPVRSILSLEIWKALSGAGIKPPWATTAEPQPATLGHKNSAVTDVHVWILDTPLPRDEFLPGFIDHPGVDGPKTELPDSLPVFGDGWVDPVAGHSAFIAGIYEQHAPGCQVTVRPVVGTMGEIDEVRLMDALDELVAEAGETVSNSIVNLSFGSPDSPEDLTINKRIEALARCGAAIVSSAGNDGSCQRTLPAALTMEERGETVPAVFAVGALKANGRVAGFSNRGSWVDVWARGEDLVSSFFKYTEVTQQPDLNFGGPDVSAFVDERLAELQSAGSSQSTSPVIDPRLFPDETAQWSGTSFATPLFGAAVARQLSGSGTTARQAASDLIAQRAEDPSPHRCIDAPFIDDEVHPWPTDPD